MDPDEDFELIDSEVEDSDIEDNEDIQTSETKKSLKPTNLFNATTNINEDNDDMDDDDMDDDDIDEDNIDIDEDPIDDLDDMDDDNNEYTNNINSHNDLSHRNFELSDDSDDDSDDEDYLQKFDEGIQNRIIEKHHPELIYHNYEEINNLSVAVRNEDGDIIDPLHKTLPFITRYEKARVIGERAKQINAGAAPMITIEPSVIDGYLIAVKEFEEKKIPFIIKRPMPNGGCEYWKLSDLEILV